MDLESECSARESVEDNEVNFVEDSNRNVGNNGSCSDDVVGLSPAGRGGCNVELGGSSSPPPTAKSPTGVTPSTRKGYGLKKWRRIKRDVVKDGSPEVDSEKVLKRGLPGSAGVNSGKVAQFMTAEVKQGSEGSVGSVNVFRSVGLIDGFGVQGLSPDSRYAIGSAFAGGGGGDSENSEDRSSRSSTAASAPKGKYGSSAVKGYAREKSRGKSLSGKMLGTQTQRSQQGKGKIDGTKKPRGERVKIETENSHSSIESDSRSSNSLFMKGASSVNSNGKQGGHSMNNDGADSIKEHASGQKPGYQKDNEFEDHSHSDLAANLSWEGKEEKIENHRLSTEQDPLLNSILSLQLVQEALEKEVQKFEEVENDLKSVIGHQSDAYASLAEFTSTKIEAHELSSSGQNGSSSLKTQVQSLTEDVKVLESKLEESRNMLEAKEFRIAELEATLNVSRSSKEVCRGSMDLQQEKYCEFETELECLFRQRIEAEVEYLAIIKTIQKMKFSDVDNSNLIREKIVLDKEQELVVDKLEKAETKAGMLKKQAAELEQSCEDIMGTEEVLKVQRNVCKATSCFILQLILLLLFFWLFVLQLKPQSGAFIPT